MSNKITERLISTFADYSSTLKDFEGVFNADLKKLTKDQQLSFGAKVEALKAKSMQFFTLCTIVKDDLGLDLFDIKPEVEELYNLQLRAKESRLPEDDKDILKFKEYLSKNNGSQKG